MKITIQEVEHVATLGRLELTEREKGKPFQSTLKYSDIY